MNQITVCANPNPLKGEVSFEQRQRMIEREMEAEQERKKKEKHTNVRDFTQNGEESSGSSVRSSFFSCLRCL